ncbi:hypothetical protein AVEN_144540-2 [Araneus ventricosus]|uniref:Uncharacterized protein n=1 Tax=Araneus ventricosus TaxID=182803 RepID=A0A4Y2S6Y4_ARAVE|nr:hypothetical protein AVEN_144540-2 [Araneus ventricosus]
MGNNRQYTSINEPRDTSRTYGITPKVPEFMMTKFKRPRNKTTDGQPKGNEDSRADFKLFAVPNPAPSKRMISNRGAGATSDISIVMETNSPSSETMTSTFITFRAVKPKEFGNKIFKSAETALKILENLFQCMEMNNMFGDMVENLTEPDCSKTCDICEKEYKGSCPVHGAMLQVLDTQVPKGEPGRAQRTLPHFFSVGISSLPKAGVCVDGDDTRCGDGFWTFRGKHP